MDKRENPASHKPEIVIVAAANCRRTLTILAFLEEHNIPHRQVSLDSKEGQQLLDRHQFRSSPGILVDGTSVNPFEILIREQCRVDERKALDIFQAGKSAHE